jgi:hypothetical protein
MSVKDNISKQKVVSKATSSLEREGTNVLRRVKTDPQKFGHTVLPCRFSGRGIQLMQGVNHPLTSYFDAGVCSPDG